MSNTVTVCIPTYNKAGFLGECISSLLNQTFTDIELMVFDDASSDNTAEVVHSFADSRLHYHRNASRLGMVANWTQCVESGLIQDGDFLALYHDDDIYHPGILKRQTDFLRSHPDAGLVHTALFYRDDETGRRVLKRPYPADRLISLDQLIDDLCERNIYHITTPSVLARKDSYRKAGNFDPHFTICPDLDLWWRMLEHYHLGYIAEPLITVRIHKQQVSSSDAAAQNAILQKETLDVLERVIERRKAKDKEFNEKYYRSRARHYCALEILRTMAKAIMKSDKNLFQAGVKRVFELSSAFDIVIIVSFLKLLNNFVGQHLLEQFVSIRKLLR